MLKAIGFDLWETLLTNPSTLGRQQERLRVTRMEEVLRRRGYAAEAAEIERAHKDVWHRCQELYWSADVDVDCRRQIVHFLEELQLDPASFSEETLGELEHAYATAAIELPPAIVAGAAEILPELRRRGLRIGLISNTGRTPGYALRRILGNAGLAQHLDVMVFSNEHGACKPKTSIFEELRNGLGAAWNEMMFVGDNLYVDVLGAQRCGMRAVHFDPPVRGAAVAPPVEVAEEIVPDARIRHLGELPAVLDALAA